MDSTAAKKTISETDLVDMVATQIEDMIGITLGESQHKMVHARLGRRMRTLEIESPQEYLAYLRANELKELPKLVSLLTTHHTFFFREFPQFSYLLDSGLPALIAQMKAEKRTHLRIWSAGCSRGEEVYSLSIFLAHHLRTVAPGFTYEILGTDICSESIAMAKNGVYHWDAIKEIPSVYLEGNWVKGKGSISDYAKVRPEIKDPCSFKIVNLKNIGDTLGGQHFDLIFCRNVFIYFIANRIKSIALDLLKHLEPSGFLFIGMTENLMGLELPVASQGLSVYRRTDAPALEPRAAKPSSPDRIRVLCVDDSPTVLKLLKHVLNSGSGFEIVGTASNGLEAAEFLKTNQVDLMTLDIHMPEQNGIEYLSRNFNDKHPPVVMVTTVAREDAELAQKAVELGASDYIEKPALDGLAQRSDEIRAKLLCTYKMAKHRNAIKASDTLTSAFSKSHKLESIELKLRVIVATPGNVRELRHLLNEFRGPQPPIVLLMTGPENMIDVIRNSLMRDLSNVSILERSMTENLSNSTVYVGQFKDFNWLMERNPDLQVSIMTLDILNDECLATVKSWPDAHLIVQDLEDLKIEFYKKMRQAANEVVPYTSFAYASDVFLNRDYVLEGNRSVVTLKSVQPTLFEKSEVVKIACKRDAFVCLYHTRKNTGAALMVPENITVQDSPLLEQTLLKLITLTGAHPDNLKAKLVGSSAVLKKMMETLAEQKIYISFAREINVPELTAYFFTDNGRLRLPRRLTSGDDPEAAPAANKKIKVLVIDDSKVIRSLLKRLIEEDGSMEVIAMAERPSEVIPLIEANRPDVITLDIEMPEMSGVELLKKLMPRHPIPTVVISALGFREGEQIVQAFELGAVDHIEKPEFSQIPLLGALIREKLRIAAASVPRVNQAVTGPVATSALDQSSLLAIGASTGGTAAITRLLSQFPSNIPPIVIAQHIPKEFSAAFAERLNKLLPFRVKEAANGDALRPGNAYVAPGGKQMEIVGQGSELKVSILESETTQLYKPSVDILFQSVAKAAGDRSIGVLLTGMGRDGADGLLQMRRKGASTFAQDRENCTVFGMPKAAIEIGAAEYVQTLDVIPKTIMQILAKKKVA